MSIEVHTWDGQVKYYDTMQEYYDDNSDVELLKAVYIDQCIELGEEPSPSIEEPKI